MFMDNFFNQNIDCDVKNCKFCNYEDGKCLLASIKIVCSNKNNKSNSIFDTICASYEKK